MREYEEEFLTKYGDTLRVCWTGDVWVAPSSGAQFAHRTEAMELELREYLSAGGDACDDPIVLSQYGEWEDE
tara:strand:+ start:2950 stop:3165 length:216 start_codon:yes stop_codon:yes gene_type:complete